MALPSIATPEFITTIPSTGQEIRYRPFLVKEEKVLLMALEGKDQKEITNAIVRLLNSCVLDEVDVGKLATFDIEYLFLQLRGKSVGEVVELTLSHTDSECKHRTKYNVNLDDIKVRGDIKDGKVMITDTIGVKMKYPTIIGATKINSEKSSGIFELITSCIEYIFDEENVYADFTPKEIDDWLGQLNQNQFKKIAEFFEGMPTLRYDLKWKCEKCGEEDEIALEGLQSFFI
jgi:hypothetical protein